MFSEAQLSPGLIPVLDCRGRAGQYSSPCCWASYPIVVALGSFLVVPRMRRTREGEGTDEGAEGAVGSVIANL
jgi:hypothetical protein